MAQVEALIEKLATAAPGAVAVLIVVLLFLKHLTREAEQRNATSERMSRLAQECHARHREISEQFGKQLLNLMNMHQRQIELLAGHIQDIASEVRAGVAEQRAATVAINKLVDRLERRE